MVDVVLLNEGAMYDIGLIPHWLDADDPRPAREQLDEHYAHGGGWQPFKGFTLRKDGGIKYPGDPTHKPRAAMMLRDELILIYDHGWVLIRQKDSSFEVARLD
jgi:hypothetical protein